MASIRIKKINDVNVRPVRLLTEPDTRLFKGRKLFPECFSNIFLCAKKKSGKTSVISRIIRDCSSKDTTVIVFCSTVDKDANWISIADYCERKEIPFKSYTSLKEEKEDLLKLFIDKLTKEAKDQDFLGDEDGATEDDAPEQNPLFDINDIQDGFVGANEDEASLGDDISDEASIEKPKRRTKYKTPKYIIIFDDLSDEIKSPSIATLLKKNRHFEILTIISSQYANDLMPGSLKNIDLFLLFKGLDIAKLTKIYKDASISSDFSDFKKMYEYSVRDKFNFFYVNCRDDEFRKNFNIEFEL